jgi:response regulator RpfG family c-di-GMP phosphodiesterase
MAICPSPTGTPDLFCRAIRRKPEHCRNDHSSSVSQNHFEENEMCGGLILIAVRPSPTRRDFQAALEHRDFRVVAADDGVRCMECLRAEVPSVLVVEPELLWGGGDGVLAILREVPQWRDIPVLVLTCERNRSAIYRISQYVISDFAFQPIPTEQLAERVIRLAPRRRRTESKRARTARRSPQDEDPCFYENAGPVN